MFDNATPNDVCMNASVRKCLREGQVPKYMRFPTAEEDTKALDIITGKRRLECYFSIAASEKCFDLHFSEKSLAVRLHQGSWNYSLYDMR